MSAGIQFLHQDLQMSWRRPTASANNGNVILLYKFKQCIGERFRFEWIDSLTVHVKRQAGIGDARYRQSGLLTEDADGLTHMLGTRGAVKAYDIDRHAFKYGECGRH